MAVTLLNLRQPLARALDDLETHQVDSAAINQVVSSTLVNNTTGASTTRYHDRYVYVNGGAAANQPRQVYGYTPAGGALTITPNFVTIPGTGYQLELTNLFPAMPCMGSDTDYRAIINRTLSLIYLKVIDTLTLAGAGNTNLTADQTAWLTRVDQIERWLEPAPVSGRAGQDASWRGIRIVLGVAPYLEIGQPYTGTLTFEGWRPANTLVNAAISTGLSTDTDICYAQERDVILVGLMLCYQILAARSAGRPTGNWSAKHKAQIELVMAEHASRMERGDRTLELAAASAAQQQAQAAA